ncbi:hypothetical protein PL8927_640004 [Planktothrix serta PCC 8927]|uniref:Uncharacterized protein n=1 Tax=Planktothrix serta PCC 8927 TaxID=671068 RepID=A0A7Z9BQ14_9CYAN|nr:hypothetical protein [Planktothrix serta]VXD19871.1 hypothetical protein PL8927_640004 [Planktothrix serta PCC 8927]
MADNKKDIWDKAAVIANLISAAIIAGIGMAINSYQQQQNLMIQEQRAMIDQVQNQFRNQLANAQLVETLIDELSDSNAQNNLKQDIALTALYNTLKDQNKQLVTDISERIIINMANYNDSTFVYAYEILKQEAPERAKPIYNQMLRKIHPVLMSGQPVKPNADLIYKLSQLNNEHNLHFVYIHIQNEQLRSVAKALENSLNQQEETLLAPSVKLIPGEYSNEIRYFYDQDLPTATHIKTLTEKLLNKPFVLKKFGTEGTEAPQGQIEIWMAG